MSRILIISFALIGLVSIAQPYASEQGAFRVLQKEGCAPFTVVIEEVGFSGFCTCNYKVGTTSISSGHVFTVPGTYVITGTAQAGANPSTDQITITVNANTQPEFEISTCNNNQVSVKVTTTQFDSYLVDFDNDNVDDATILKGGNQSATFDYGSSGLKTISIRGKDVNALDNCSEKLQPFTAVVGLSSATINSLDVTDAASITLNYTPAVNYQYRAQVSTNSGNSFQPFQNFNSATATPQNITLNSLAADDNYYCFRLNSYDPCTNASVSSNIICSANFDAVAASDVNQLNWGTFTTGISNYTVVRDLTNYQTVNVLNYNDTGIDCNTEYDYSITMNYANGSVSRSLTKSVTSFTNTVPATIENTSAVVGDGAVELSWIQDPAFTATQYSLQRSAHSGAFELLGTSSVTDYTDDTYTTEDHFCYQISYTDVCAKTSLPSENVCPIQLTGSLNNLNQATIDWSAYEGWDQGVRRYKIEKFDADGALLNTIYRSVLTYSDLSNDVENQIVKYKVTAEPRDATLAVSESNTITLKKQARLVFPTAFTPNKDRLNDTFTVEGQFVESMKLQIFDRWGVLLFSTESNEAWDGTHEGRLMPESTYIWKAFITDKAGDKFSKIGSVALLRK